MMRHVYTSNEKISLVEHRACDNFVLYHDWFDPETQRGYNGWTPGCNFEEFQQRKASGRFYAMIQCNETGEIAGIIGLSPPEEEADLHIRIFAPYRRQGYGTATFALAAKYATEVLGIKELHAGAYPDNFGSKKMLERCGFVPNPAGSIQEKHYLTGEDVIQMDYIYRPGKLKKNT